MPATPRKTPSAGKAVSAATVAPAEKGPSGRPTPAPAANVGAPVDAETLTRAYAADPKGAARRYGGKPVLIRGKAATLGRFMDGKFIIDLAGHLDRNRFTVLMPCYCPKEREGRFAAVVPGQLLTVRGTPESTGGGGEVLPVYLEGCDLVEAGPSPALHATAERLAAECRADRDAAEKKYQDRYVIFEGVLATAEPKGKFQYAVSFEVPPATGKQPFIVNAYGRTRSDEERQRLHALARGKKVKLRGQLTSLTEGEVTIREAALSPPE